MEPEPREFDPEPTGPRFGWGALVIIAVAVIGVAANLVQPGTPWAIGLFAAALVGLALFLRSERDRGDE